MTREEYRTQLTNSLSGRDYYELREYARAHHIKLYTRVPDKMVYLIVEAMTSREFHGDAFRDKPLDASMHKED